MFDKSEISSASGKRGVGSSKKPKRPPGWQYDEIYRKAFSSIHGVIWIFPLFFLPLFIIRDRNNALYFAVMPALFILLCLAIAGLFLQVKAEKRFGLSPWRFAFGTGSAVAISYQVFLIGWGIFIGPKYLPIITRWTSFWCVFILLIATYIISSLKEDAMLAYRIRSEKADAASKGGHA